MKNDNIKLKKLSIEQLNEILERETKLLKNKKIINSLKDKGSSIKEFCIKLENEIKFRKDMTELEISINKLNINSNDNSNCSIDKHTKYICGIEKNHIQDEASLLTIKTINSKSKATTNQTKKVQSIPLSDSLNLLQEQADKVKKEQQKIRERIESSEEESDSESDNEED